MISQPTVNSNFAMTSLFVVSVRGSVQLPRRRDDSVVAEDHVNTWRVRRDGLHHGVGGSWDAGTFHIARGESILLYNNIQVGFAFIN